jgi:hypothetical protein
MLKIDNNAFRALWYMMEWPIKALVPLVAVTATVVNALSAQGSASNVLNAVLFTVAICAAPALTIWLIGMTFDFFVLVLKVSALGIIFLIRKAVSIWRRRKEFAVFLPAYRGPKVRQD